MDVFEVYEHITIKIQHLVLTFMQYSRCNNFIVSTRTEGVFTQLKREGVLAITYQTFFPRLLDVRAHLSNLKAQNTDKIWPFKIRNDPQTLLKVQNTIFSTPIIDQYYHLRD